MSMGGSATSIGSGRPHGREQRQVPVVALVAERLAAEALEDRPERQHVVAQAGPGRIELHAVAPLDVRADLGAEAEPEAPAGGLGQLPRDLGGDHRAAGEGDGDAGEDVEVGGGERGRRAAEVGGAPGLGDHEAREPGRRRVPGEGLHPRERHRGGHQVDAHPDRMPARRAAGRRVRNAAATGLVPESVLGCGHVLRGVGAERRAPPSRPAGHRPAAGRAAGRVRRPARHRRRHPRGRAGRHRGGVAPGGLRRAGRPHRDGPRPAHPARRLVGPLRGPGRRQPPPPHLPHLRPHGRRRLRGRRHAVPHGRRRLGLRDRRGRGHLLGPMPRLQRPSAAASDDPHSDQPKHPTSTGEGPHVSESENPAIDAPEPKPAAGPGPTRTGGRTSSTCRCSTSTRRRATRSATTSTTRKAFARLDVDALKRDIVARDAPTRRTGGRPTTATTARCSSA